MKKFPIIVGVITLILIAGGVFLFSAKSGGSESKPSGTPPPLPANYEYFWGEGCPHCKIVDEFLSSWDKKDKITIDKKEVFYNKENQKLMRQRAEYCNLDQKNLGVPLVFTPDGKCLISDQPIIEYFKNLKV